MKNNNDKVINLELKGKKDARRIAVIKRKEMERRNEIKKIKIFGVVSALAIAATLGVGSYTDAKVDKAAKKLAMQAEIDERQYEAQKQLATEDFYNRIKVSADELENTDELSNTTDVMEKILEKYNSQMPDEVEKINREDLGIVKESLGNGNIYRSYDSEDKVKYIQNHIANLGEEGRDIDWVDAEDIENVIAIIDKENHTAIAGMGEIDGEYVPVEIQQMILGSEPNNPYVESDYYVRLKGSKENYEKLEEAYQKRVKELNEQSKGDSEMEIS